MRARLLLAGTAMSLACGDGDPVRPPAEAACDGRTQAVVSLARYEGTLLEGDAVHCTVLAGAGARYLVLPQLTGATLPYGGFGFRIGDPAAIPSAAVLADGLATALQLAAGDAQAALDARLRTRERDVAARVVRAPFLRAGAPAHAAAPAALAAQRRFSVLSTLDATPRWSAVGAALRFEGTRVAIYVDTLAADAISAAELAAMGALYDDALAPRVRAAFGDGSDIDGNGRVILLLSPTVNALMPAADCATRGYVRGFFYGHDLTSTDSTANRGEVFYAYVPDPSGRWSCAHTKADVLANLPPTFVHELQHMISYGEHVLERGGPSEEPWLNEGLSHVAEEIGSLYWEERFPVPTGRADPSQLFPDSASPYITPNLLYSYRFLAASAAFSLTSCAPGSFCSQSERGGSWLFLRWLADQKGADALRRLVETVQVGRTNLEAVTGERTAALLGDFAIAVNADSLEGVARTAVPARFRLGTRNLRALYHRLFEAYGFAGGVGRPFPIVPAAIPAGEARTGTMRPGSFSAFSIETGEGTATVRLRFAVPDGSAFPATSGAQVAIFRVR